MRDFCWTNHVRVKVCGGNVHGQFVPITEISGWLGGWRELSLVRQIGQSLKDCIIPLLIMPEVYSHLQLFNTCKRLCLFSQRGQAALSFFFHSCRLTLFGRVLCAALRANFIVLNGRPLPTQLLCPRWWYKASLPVSGGLAPAVASDRPPDFHLSLNSCS